VTRLALAGALAAGARHLGASDNVVEGMIAGPVLVTVLDLAIGMVGRRRIDPPPVQDGQIGAPWAPQIRYGSPVVVPTPVPATPPAALDIRVGADGRVTGLEEVVSQLRDCASDIAMQERVGAAAGRAAARESSQPWLTLAAMSGAVYAGVKISRWWGEEKREIVAEASARRNSGSSVVDDWWATT
jgi:hypothetical protein